MRKIDSAQTEFSWRSPASNRLIGPPESLTSNPVRRNEPTISVRSSRSLSSILSLALAVAVSQAPAWAENTRQSLSPFERYSQQGQDALDKGQYKRAESSWNKAINALEQAGQKDESLARSLKRLGEAFLREGKYPEAEHNLRRSTEIYQALAAADAELGSDLAQLGMFYRSVDISKLGEYAANALAEANVLTMGIFRSNSGNHVQIALPGRFTKQIDNPDVDQLGFDRMVTFDIAQDPDGTVKINNIKGMHVRAKFWVNITDSLFKRGENGERIADVTAQKMGISKTVTAHLPSSACQPIDGLIGQLLSLPEQTSTPSVGESRQNPASLEEKQPQSKTAAQGSPASPEQATIPPLTTSTSSASEPPANPIPTGSQPN